MTDADNLVSPESPDTSLQPIAPVNTAERISSVDTLRGIALLGILAMNIYAFALPMTAYSNPLSYGGSTGMNFYTWLTTHLFFDQKFMAIFSMLFGAGVILLHNRAEAAGRASFAGPYYRRLLWLLIIGLIHAYLIWWGDILAMYALSGLILYLFRRRSARTLIIVGILVMAMAIPIKMGAGHSFVFLKQLSADALQAELAGEQLTIGQQQGREQWANVSEMMHPTQEKIIEELEAFRGGYTDNLAARVPIAAMLHTQAFPFIVSWRIIGLMILGMGLLKLGVFSAARSTRFYLVMLMIGYLVGLPLIALGAKASWAAGFDFIAKFKMNSHYNYIGSVLVALAHISVVMLLCKSGRLAGLMRRFGAVGRMAFTNYLMHSILLTPIFYGFGLGLFGKIERFPLMAFVVAVWIIQLLLSQWWLERYRFGPAEWVWRSLTYMQRQPMRRI